MRIALSAVATLCIALSAPALAAPYGDEGYGEASRAAEDLRDPATQERIAGTMDAAMDAMLGMPAGPLLRAMAEIAGDDPEAIDPDLRVGDLVGPEAADAPREFAYRLPAMMASMAAMAAAMEQMLPEMRERMVGAVPHYYEY